MCSSSPGALLDEATNAHDTADDAANNRADEADDENDRNDDGSAHASVSIIPGRGNLVALVLVAGVCPAITLGCNSAGFAVAEPTLGVVVAHYFSFL